MAAVFFLWLFELLWVGWLVGELVGWFSITWGYMGLYVDSPARLGNRGYMGLYVTAISQRDWEIAATWGFM